MLRWESNYHSVYSDFTNSTIAIVVKRQIHQSIHLRVYYAAFIHLLVQNITSNIIIRTILTTAKDHNISLCDMYVEAVKLYASKTYS